MHGGLGRGLANSIVLPQCVAVLPFAQFRLQPEYNDAYIGFQPFFWRSRTNVDAFCDQKFLDGG